MLTTRAILSSFHVHLDNGDKNFKPYTHLLIRLEVLDDLSGVISSATQSAMIDHDDDIPTQMGHINNITLGNGFNSMDKSQTDKLTDHFASIAAKKAKGP